MPIPRFLNLLLLLLAVSSFAQKEVGYPRIPVEYTLSFVRSDSSVFNNSNEILKEIAANRVINLRDVRLNLKFNAIFRDTVVPGGQARLAFSFSPAEISGNYFYRSFDLRGVLTPNRMVVNPGLFNPADSTFIPLGEIRHGAWPGSGQPVITVNPLPGNRDSFLPELRNLRLYFDEEGWKAFLQARDRVDDYYAVSAVLDSVEPVLNQCRYEELPTVPEWYIRLAEAGWILTLIRERELPQNLDLSAYDPLHVANRLEEAWKRYLSLAMTFRQRFHGTPAIGDSAVAGRLLKLFLETQERYIRWSMLVKERNSSLYREYLDRCFAIPVFGDDTVFIRHIVEEIYPGIRVDSSAFHVSRRIVAGYREEAARLTGLGLNAESVELIGNGKRFFSANPYLPAGMLDERELEAAAGGIYVSLLAIAGDALQRKRFSFAERYLQRAIEYRNEHPGLNFPDSLHRELVRRILSGRLAECDTLRVSGSYEEALDCYRGILYSTDSLTRHLLSVDLGKRMDECRYQMLKKDGISRYALRDFTGAGRSLQECLILRKKWQFPADSLADSLGRMTYAWYLAGVIRDQEALIWRDDLAGAGFFADSLQRLLGSERFPDDSVAKAGLESFLRKVALRSCYRKKEAADVYCYRAWLHLEQRRFARAGVLLDSALSVLNGTGSCDFETREIKDSLQKYEAPIRYQQRMQEIEQCRVAQQYDSVVSRYADAARFFDQGRLSRFGLSCEPLYDYVYRNENGLLTTAALRYYLAGNKPDEALRYLEMLRLEAVPEKNVKEEIRQLSAKLAERDFSLFPDTDPAFTVVKYTGDLPGYSKFRFFYLYRWNELRNSDTEIRK